MHSHSTRKVGRRRAGRTRGKRMRNTEKHLQVTCSSIDMAIMMIMMLLLSIL